MTTRRGPLQPLAPPSANVVNTRYAHVTTKSTNDYVAMQEQAQEDTRDLASVVSDLSDLEHGADEFERLMIQNARDERRLNEALHGKVQAFRKARPLSRVGLTKENLQDNNARNYTAPNSNAHVKFQSPPSSSGSTRSDPAIHAPAGWGRKSRSNRNWMRTITYEEEAEQQQQRYLASDVGNGLQAHQYQQHESDAEDAHVIRRSVEDSPLSHKSSIHGTPRNDRSADWDLTFELNEASMIASTPYIPRNTALDDIRQQEIDSLKEQAVATARLDRIRESSPEQIRRPRSASNKSATNAAVDPIERDHVIEAPVSSEKKIHKRTSSWQSIGKSQAVTGTGKDSLPITSYKTSTEPADLWHAENVAGPARSPARPVIHRRADSQDLLRRLARVSNTPSPRPQTAPPKQPNSSSQMISTGSTPTPREKKDHIVHEARVATAPVESSTKPSQEEDLKDATREESKPAKTRPQKLRETVAEDVDATPMPVEQTILLPKTPVVTGAWVDTPGPRTVRNHIHITRTPPQSPKRSSPRKGRSPQKVDQKVDPKVAQEVDASTVEETLAGVAAETIRPQLPSSALQAVVHEARSNERSQSIDYGDSTINSLEELIASAPGEKDEDTLQGLEIPSGTPKTEAERLRLQELLHLHRMNDRLRAARTSIRDASRGMKRVEDRVEHGEEVVELDGQTKVIVRECQCASEGGHEFSMWKWWKSLFWSKRLKQARQGTNWATWGGITGLGIFMTVFMVWWLSEEIACEIYCHHPYTNYSPYPFGVNPNAPRYPFVIPTLIYRNLIKAWWLPLWSFLTWVYTSIVGTEAAPVLTKASFTTGLRKAATRTAAWSRAASSEVAEDIVWDQSMMHDEIVR